MALYEIQVKYRNLKFVTVWIKYCIKAKPPNGSASSSSPNNLLGAGRLKTGQQPTPPATVSAVAPPSVLISPIVLRPDLVPLLALSFPPCPLLLSLLLTLRLSLGFFRRLRLTLPLAPLGFLPLLRTIFTGVTQAPTEASRLANRRACARVCVAHRGGNKPKTKMEDGIRKTKNKKQGNEKRKIHKVTLVIFGQKRSVPSGFVQNEPNNLAILSMEKAQQQSCSISGTPQKGKGVACFFCCTFSIQSSTGRTWFVMLGSQDVQQLSCLPHQQQHYEHVESGVFSHPSGDKVRLARETP